MTNLYNYECKLASLKTKQVEIEKEMKEISLKIKELKGEYVFPNNVFQLFVDNNDLYYINSNGNWYTSDQEGIIKAIDPVERPYDTLLQCEVTEIDYPSYMTNCDNCNNSGWYKDFYGDLEVCDCYHGQAHGEESIQEYKRSLNEDNL